MLLKISNKIIGFDSELNFFIKLYQKKNLPNCILFEGLDGIGKFTFSLHLINSLLNKEKNDFEQNLYNDFNVKILNKDDSDKEYKIEDIRKIIDFCKLTSLKPRFVVIKNINYLNKNSINALLKLTEEPSKNIYFFFTSNLLLPCSETLKSRFFKQKLFLNKKFYRKVINYYIECSNIEKFKFDENFYDTPGDFIRKYLFNIDKDYENLKENNENLFYKILSEKIIKKNIEVLHELKKIKLNLNLKNDFKKMYNKMFLNE